MTINYLDSSFSGDGKLLYSTSTGSEAVTGLLVQHDGDILVTGQNYNGSNWDAFLLRFEAGGSPDATFGNGGKVTLNLGDHEYAGAAALQSDGTILIAGASGANALLARYRTNGTLDTSFDTGGNRDGIVLTDVNTAVYNFGFQGTEDRYHDLAVRSDGYIIAVGQTDSSHTEYTWSGRAYWVDSYEFMVVRYTSDGRLDTSFDYDGKAKISFGNANEGAFAVALQSDGAMIVGGSSGGLSALARLTNSGTLDPSFDGDGMRSGDLTGAIEDIAVLADGKILVRAGATLARYTTSGSLDTSFSDDGKLTISAIAPSAMTVAGDGSILLGGSSEGRFALYRLDAAGNPVADFGGNGRAVADLSTAADSATEVALDGDGNIVLAGAAGSDIGVARLLDLENPPPVIALADSMLTYREGAAAIRLDATAIASEPELEWLGGGLLARIAAGASEADRLYLLDGDGDAMNITVNGSNLYANGTDIGDLSVAGGSVSGAAALAITFARGTSNGMVQEVVRSLRFDNISHAPVAGTRTVSVTLTDTLGAPASDSRDISLVAVRPTLSLVDTPVQYTERDPAVSIGGAAIVSEPEGDAEWIGGTLTAQIAAGASSWDRLRIVDQDGDGLAMTISGSDLLANGVDVGDLNAVEGTAAGNQILRVTWGATVTTAIVQETVQSLRFDHSSLAPASVSRRVDVTVTDQYGESASDSRTIEVTAITPTLILASTGIGYTEGDVAQRIAAAGTVADAPGDAGWAGGTLRLRIASNAHADDRLLIEDGDGDGIVLTINGTNLYANKVDVGDLSVGGGVVVGGTTLTVTFDADAGNAIVEEALQSLRYYSASYDPPLLERSLTLTVANAAGETASGSVAIAVTQTRAGDPDRLFSSDGKAANDLGPGSEQARAVAVAPDGKIVLAGRGFGDINDDFILARYGASGSLDPSFGEEGSVRTDFGFGDDEVRAIAMDADGRILVAGVADNGMNRDIAVARYLSDGSLDNTFAETGMVLTDFDRAADPARGHDEAIALAILPGGRILVAGSSHDGTGNDFALACYQADGSLDPSFGGDGLVTTDFAASEDRAQAMAIQADGKILVAGRTWRSGQWDIAVVRYNADGSLDPSFDDDGKLVTGIGRGSDEAYGIAVQNDGRIVVVGQSHNGRNYDLALVRYNDDGRLDAGFDGDGKLTTAFGTSYDYGRALALQPDGKIVVLGQSMIQKDWDYSLARFDADGSLDGAFNGDGKVTMHSGGVAHDEAHGLALQPDGRIVAAGASLVDGKYQFSLARYLNDLTIIGADGDGGGLNGTTNQDAITGTGAADSIDAGAGDDIVDGGAGDDIVDGGAGIDTLSYVSAPAPVRVSLGQTGTQATGGAGNDTVGNFENLLGSRFDDLLTAGPGNNRINGGAGSDTVSYAEATAGVVANLPTERASGGSGDDVLLNIENLIGSAYADNLRGDLGDNRLDGGAGDDTLAGGVGNDSYVVDSVRDAVTEAADSGTDWVLASVSYTLGSNLEDLELTGMLAINGVGNGFANRLVGNAGNNALSGKFGDDVLAGGLGNDVLTGGAGNDLFVFATALDAAGNVDQIADFARTAGNVDRIYLSDDIFVALGPVTDVTPLPAGAFVVGRGAGEADDRIIYDQASGALYYDADGTGELPAVHFAAIGATSHPALAASDFYLSP